MENSENGFSVEEVYDILLEDDSQAFWYFPPLKRCFLVTGPKSVRPHSTDAELALIPGSFNPLHDGHRWFFENSYCKRTAYEMSISRIDKPIISLLELKERLIQFNDAERVIITNSPRMIHKIALLRGYTVVIHCGIDTILRMADDYGIIGIGGLMANFIVTDRKMDGKMLTYPPGWKRKPTNVHRSANQMPDHLIDISSTALRNRIV